MLLLLGTASAEAAEQTTEPAIDPAETPTPEQPPTPKASELTNDELFEKVFKTKPPSAPIEVLMPVYYENQERSLGMIKTKVGASPGDIMLESSPLFGHLNKVVDPTFYKPMEIAGDNLTERNYDGDKWIPISVFRNAGYKVIYNESKLEIRISVPPELRKVKSTSLSNNDQGYEGEPPISPSLLSAFVNVIANEDYQTGISSSSDGRQPLRAQFNGAVNLASFVFESSAKFVENKSRAADFPLWQRGDARLIKDYPGLTLRQTVGDLNYPTRDFQTFRPMGGVSLNSQFGLQPSRLTIPTGNYEVFLKRPSRVAIFINEQQRQVLDLPAGKHNLRDFPFTSGLNDLRLEITDDLGQTESVLLSYFSNTELLKPGIHQVNYAVGAPSTQLPGTPRAYDTSLLTGSIFHRYGLAEFLTLGANLQLDRTQSVAGAEVLFSTKLGFLKVAPAVSILPGLNPTAALLVRYLYSDFSGPLKAQRTFGLGVETRTLNFAPLNSPSTQNVTAYDLTATYGQAISRETSANLSGSYQINRKLSASIQDGYRLGLGLNHRFSPAISTNVNLSQAQTSLGINDASVAVFLNWTFTKERQFVTASYNPKDDSMRATWNAMPKTNLGTGLAVGIDKIGSSRGFDGKIQNMNNRSIVAVNHRSQWTPDQPNPNQLTNVQVSSALVYAGGHFGISRPVIDSFVIVTPVYSARGQDIELNPQRDGSYAAKTDFLDDAILPELPSYNYLPLKVGTEKLKIGTSIDHDHFVLYPTYKSGYSIEVGSEATVSISLLLVNPDGSPIAMQPGEVRPLSGSSSEPIPVFTGRRGQMRAQGFKPGKYELRLFGDKWISLEFEIPEKSDGIHEMGKFEMRLRNK